MCLEATNNGLYRQKRHSSWERVEWRAKTTGARILRKTYMSESDLQFLCNYRNKGTDLSLSYRYILSPIYDRLIQLVPMWMAPNVVTLLGLSCVLLSHVVAMIHAPYLTEEAPRWVYFLLWAGLCSYMTLDNLDGRQARRTGTSSPLGHLFDHGCDTLNVFITGLNTAMALRLGSNVWSLALVWTAGMLLFFTATLEEYYNSALNLGFINGPNEGLLIIQGIYLGAAIFGADVWTQDVTVAGFPFRLGHLFVFILLPLGVPTVIANYVSIFNKWKLKGEGGKIVNAFKSSIPFAVFSICIFLWEQTSTAFALHPCLFLWCTGLNFFYIISRLIVAHLTATHFPSIFGMALPMIVGAANAVLGRFLTGSEQGMIDQYLLLWSILIVHLCVNTRRVYSLTNQICKYLNIQCLRIPSSAHQRTKEEKTGGKKQ